MIIKNPPMMIESLSGIRALAILLVIFRHGVKGALEKFNINIDSPFVIFMINGWSGVDLFFVLSGFLIGYHLQNRWPNEPSKFESFIRSYIYKRCVRILPIYYASIAVVLLLPTSIYSIHSHNVTYDLAIHSVFLQDYLGSNFIVSLWSLASEIKFYILAPLILYFFLKVNSKILLIITFTVISLILYSQYIALSEELSFISYSHFFWKYRAPFHYAFLGLFIGMILAIFYAKDGIPLWIKNKGNIVVLFSLALLTFILSSQSYASDNANWILTIFIIAISIALYSLLILGAIYSKSLINKILSSKISHFISKISYPLYAIHMVVIPCSLQLSNSILQFVVIYILSSVLSAYILHICIENPFMKLKRNF
ncbi:O-acetyltransferase OatA [Shewanella sp. P1-14-1]|uniref:acyltransferase family protein n=1 Tax=Shewanella sp. P1-14-1 TaxID=1723761 RepID=UPI0006D68DDF|nr:acyltransferase [Shewanella sp. P1-14-1]KPZ73200.1 O-acetyltransferase OatA [Shewanella sp. P1-14-1]